MSFAYRSGREWRVLALLLVLGATSGAHTAQAASFAIDIDPSSPTLGDLLDRESRTTRTPAKTSANPRVAPSAPVSAPPPAQATAPVALPLPRSVSSEPIVPRNAATVNVKRAKSRTPLPPTRPKPQPEASVLAPKPDVATRINPAPSSPRAPAPVVDMPAPPPRPLVRVPVEITAPPVAQTRLARQPEALPPALETQVPTPRPAPRKIEIPPTHPQAKASAVRDQAALLRDPTITNSSEPLAPASGGRAKGKARSFEDEEQDLPPASAPAPRVVLPPLEEPARAAPPRSTPKAAEPTAPKSVPEVKAAPATKPVEAPKAPAAKAELGKADGAKVDTAKADPAAKSPAEGDKIVYVIDQDLRQFLTDFARRSGLRSDIAANVRGRLTKVKLPAEPNALLRELERRHDFEWVIEGEILKVSSRAEMATRILPLGSLAYDDLVREMKNADIDAARYPMRKLGDSNAIFITAPATHIGRIAALIDVLKAGKTVGPDLRIVRNGITRKVEWD